jgi:hypothetical protein
LSKSGGYVPNGGNKMRAINFYLFEESAIPNLIKFLAIPRPDGLQQVVKIKFRPARQHQLAQKIMENIKQVDEKIHKFNAFIYTLMICPGIPFVHSTYGAAILYVYLSSQFECSQKRRGKSKNQ